MKFNLSHLRRIAVDKDFTTLQHPSGHEIKIAHKHLQPKMRGELEAVPMAEGGDPADQKSIKDNMNAEIDQEIANADAAAQKAEPMPQAQPVPTPVPEKTYEVPGASPLQLPQADMGTVKNDPYGTQNYLQNYGQGLQETKQGIENQANAESQQSREAIPVLQKQADDLGKLQGLYKEHLDKLNGERQAMMDDLSKGHIDPNHYWEDKSLPGKVGTAIGLILGGMGGALTGQENPALKLLNMNIERDIQAQKLNMSNKHSLLNVNRQQFQNENDATNMLRVMKTDQVSQELKLAAARSGDPMAKARALQAAGQLDMQAAPIVSQMAMRRSMLSGAQSGQIDPSTIIRFSPIIPEGEKEAAFKELATMQNMNKSKSNLLGGWDKFNSLNTYGKRAVSPLQTGSMMKTIEADLGQLAKDSEGRVTTADVDYLKTQLPTITDDKQTRDYKRNKFNSFISEKMNFPRLKSAGIDTENSGRFNAQGQNKIQESAPRIK